MKGRCLKLAIIILLLAAPNLTRATDYLISLDAPEQAAMAETLRYAMEHNQINQESTWVNPDTGHSGSIMPVRSFYSSQGLHCREYFQTLRFDDTLERLLGIACRQPDGVWEVMHEQLLSDAYLQLEGSPYVDRDPYDHYYPWVYYEPFDYPHPIYFSFVFVSHRHHFEPRHFHSGHRFHTPQFRDGRHLAPRQRLPRDQRPQAPVVREQPTAPRFDRGAAPPRQRVDNDRSRAQRQTQPETRAPEHDRAIEQPLRRPQPAVKERPLPPAETSRPSERVQRKEQPADPPPAGTRLREDRTPEQTDEGTKLRRNGDGDDRRSNRGEKLRRDERSDDDDRGRRGKESKRSDRRERDREDQEERPSRSGDQSRGHR